MTPLISSGGNPDYDTSCSYPTAVFAADLWNAIDAIKLNRPNTTQAEAARIVKKEFLQTEVMKIKDPDTGELVERIKDPVSGEMVGGGHISTIDERKLINHEVWQQGKLDLIQFNADDVTLPMMPWTFYEGMGVYFKVHGVNYPNTISNQAVLEQALIAGEVEGWWRSRTLWKKQGGKDTVELKVRTVDTQARLFLKDHYLTVTKPVLSE